MLWKSTTAVLACLTVCFSQPPSDIGHEVAVALQAGKYEEALRLVESALKGSPRNARLWTLDGLALERLEKQEEAQAAFRRALQLAPDYLPALEGSAQLEYEAGRDDAALLLLNHILKLRPDDPTTHGMLGAIAVRRGECEKAKDEFGKSQSSGMDEVQGLREYGACLIKQKRIEQAIPIFAKVHVLQPADARALYELAVVQFLKKDYPEVIRLLDTARVSGKLNAESFELLGESYEAVSDTQRAIEALHEATVLDPTEPRYFTDAAYLCQAHRDFPQGLAIVNLGLKSNPNAASLYVARGILHSEMAQYDEGLSDFSKAETIDPSIELSSEARGLADLQQNDLAKAEKTAREQIRQHPRDAFLYYLLGETLRKKGVATAADYNEAVDTLRRAIALDPKLTLAQDSLGGLYLQHGEIKAAVTQSRAAYRGNSSDETALYHLIVALRKSGETSELPQLLKQLALLKKRSQPQDFLQQRYDSVAPALKAP